LPIRLLVQGDRANLEIVCREFSTGLCLYEQIGEDDLWIHGGQIAARFSLQSGDGTCRLESIKEPKVVGERLQKWLVSVRHNRDEVASRKGICPATLIFKVDE
jgi:hypothetical protein